MATVEMAVSALMGGAEHAHGGTWSDKSGKITSEQKQNVTGYRSQFFPKLKVDFRPQTQKDLLSQDGSIQRNPDPWAYCRKTAGATRQRVLKTPRESEHVAINVGVTRLKNSFPI